MNRRQFLLLSGTTVFSALVAETLGIPRFIFGEKGLALADTEITPLAEITAVVDILVPSDPLIPGDFKGSDFWGDKVLAGVLGELGQATAAGILNNFSKQVNGGKRFMECTPDEQMLALKQWIIERETQSPLFSELLTGILTISVIGTYEIEDPDMRTEMFTSMGWYDPQDPSGTFRIPCEGYVDANKFPVRLKKGLTQ